MPLELTAQPLYDLRQVMAESTSIEIVQVPWESKMGGVVRRYFATLAQAVHPVRSAPGFAGQRLGPGVRFALLSAVPLAALAGIIPYTRTLLFEPGLRISPIGEPSTQGIVLDVARAMGTSLLVTLVYLAALALPYISLCRVYGHPDMRQVAPRILLYRAWLVPLAALVGHGVYWFAAAPSSPENLAGASALASLLPQLLLFLAMRQTAQRISGVPTLMSFIVVIIPFVLFDLVRGLLMTPWAGQ